MDFLFLSFAGLSQLLVFSRCFWGKKKERKKNTSIFFLLAGAVILLLAASHVQVK